MSIPFMHVKALTAALMSAQCESCEYCGDAQLNNGPTVKFLFELMHIALCVCVCAGITLNS